MHCYVSLNGQTSSVFPVLQGVRQGGVLSPWLFLCYNNDIPDVLQSADYGLSVQDINCSSVLVADDVTLISLRIKGLQSLLAKMEMYSYQWRFECNPSKTTIVTFGEATQMHLLKKLLRSWYINGVKDIVEVLGKYELYHYLEDYIKTGMFPNKRSWRNYVVRAIDEHETECWKNKMQCRPNLKHLRENHQKLQPIVHWEVLCATPRIGKYFRI